MGGGLSSAATIGPNIDDTEATRFDASQTFSVALVVSQMRGAPGTESV
jgi:hypothetical protein